MFTGIGCALCLVGCLLRPLTTVVVDVVAVVLLCCCAVVLVFANVIG